MIPRKASITFWSPSAHMYSICMHLHRCLKICTCLCMSICPTAPNERRPMLECVSTASLTVVRVRGCSLSLILSLWKPGSHQLTPLSDKAYVVMASRAFQIKLSLFVSLLLYFYSIKSIYCMYSAQIYINLFGRYVSFWFWWRLERRTLDITRRDRKWETWERIVYIVER